MIYKSPNYLMLAYFDQGLCAPDSLGSVVLIRKAKHHVPLGLCTCSSLCMYKNQGHVYRRSNLTMSYDVKPKGFTVVQLAEMILDGES